MRVNSAFTGFFTNRLVVGSGIATVMLAIFFIASSFTERSSRDIRAKQINLIIRQAGHRLLQQAGDSTSRVLPVTEIKEGTFLLRFENEFVFNHDSLMVLSQGLLPKTEFPSGYTVTVHDCMKGGIVYGFQVNNTSPDILACSGRSQPRGCYTIEFAFPDFYENVKQKKADIDQLTESVKVGTQEVNSKLKEFKTAAFDQRAEELKSVKMDPKEVNPKLEELKTTTFDYPLIHVVYGGILVLLGVTLLIGRFWENLKPVPGQNQNYAIIKESVPELAALGSFLFNVKGQRLLLGSEVISLTDKECKVLELLHKNFGELIPRETLMQEVWINEGVFTGRSLDMFVSKLRKKLSHDPELRITNVHGKGYKLEIPERPII
ncbi:winged helix-turn-helix domain-containing protein [Dyadobacter sp. LHD-138]|uniref:winged helix-turn-helix domain-containing protein n=1 Tax=Dyadobacter sp. LHD-138 TaxID=3071413 RepID=UPI0027DEAD14|nr:winged helix-turn-helix domain-containing protein [Dyadobacter sp. LHD-138]MDQ6476878.1 winged helix-turn-helix domain-containing protein [Dyadobacter sp. LHD-138]